MGDEVLQALLAGTPEYDGGSTGLLTINTFILGNTVPPLLANPLVVAINQAVLSLSSQVLSQQQTIDSLVVADFGGAVTADAASAELAVAANEIAQVRAILRNRCQLDVVCPFVDLKQLA